MKISVDLFIRLTVNLAEDGCFFAIRKFEVRMGDIDEYEGGKLIKVPVVDIGRYEAGYQVHIVKIEKASWIE